MKSIEDIQIMLAFEIRKSLEKGKPDKGEDRYFNVMLGETSFLLAALLQRQLEKTILDWDRQKWIDDSLIEKYVISGNSIGGIMIWGLETTTEQWTDPFYFHADFSKDNLHLKNYTFLFCDLEREEISYIEFNKNRNYWNLSNRNWKYIINSEIL